MCLGTFLRRGAVALATIYPCAECASSRSIFIVWKRSFLYDKKECALAHSRAERGQFSITCYAGYCAVHLLRKYTTMLDFLPRYKKKPRPIQRTRFILVLPPLFTKASRLLPHQVHTYSPVITVRFRRSLLDVSFGAQLKEVFMISFPCTSHQPVTLCQFP